MEIANASLNKPGFRYDINALRAIAVLGVVLFHFKVPYFDGGFSGVDIFFVISGYLMSRIIFLRMEAGKFSILDFYGQRLKRIVPALLVLVFLVTLICFFLYLPEDYKINLRNAGSSVVFLSNIFYWMHSGYFDPVSNTNLFLHTWSLSVEWQFYLLYPLMIAGLFKVYHKRSNYYIVFSVAVLVLFVLSALYTIRSPSGSFYLLPTRSWEMLAGGVVFLLENKLRQFPYRRMIALIGYGLLLLFFLMLREAMAWPGIYTVLPVVVTAMIIGADFNEFRLLKLPGIQLLGKISYSLYLWHWPIYVIAQYFGIPFSIGSVIIMIGLSFIMGYLSFRYVESIKVENNIVIVGMMSILCLTIVSMSLFHSNKFLFNAGTLKLAAYKKDETRDDQFSLGKCFITSKYRGIVDYNKEQCLCISKTKKNFLLIGDSHAAQFSASLNQAFDRQNFNLLQATASGCYPLLSRKGEIRCTEIRDYVFDTFIVKNAKNINGVIISANWTQINVSDSIQLLSDIQTTINYLKKYDIPLIFIGQNETYTIPYPTIAAKEFQYNVKMDSKYLSRNSYDMNRFLKTKLGTSYIEIFNKIRTHLSSDNTPYMSDDNHFTKYGADLALDRILAGNSFRHFSKQKQ